MSSENNFEKEALGKKHRGHPGFAGYRIEEFTKASRDALEVVASRLIPHEVEIVDGWIQRQYSVWQPPGITRDELRQVFGSLFRNMLGCMNTRQLEKCIVDLEQAGAMLARQNFPYEALIVSLHFLEESYMRYLLDQPSKKTLKWLIELDEFLHAMLAAIATSYFRVHRKALLEEAEVGRIVQEGLLADIPATVLDLEVAYVYIASGRRAMVGGDFIDLFTLDSQRAAFIVGDLSGHGLEAATDSAMLRFLFRGFMRENPDVGRTAERLNRVLARELRLGQFATALAGVYERGGGLMLVSAGHPAPVICDSACRTIETRGIILGIDESSTFDSSGASLEDGAIFVAYTDGLTEARRDSDFFGEERVIGAIAAMREAPARVIAEHLRDEALRHAGGELTDDVAILVLKRTGGGRS